MGTAILDESEWRKAPRSYEGSALQRHHQQRNADAKVREAFLAKHEAQYGAALSAERAAAIKAQKAANVRFHAAKRRSALVQRTPPWADLEAIRAIYSKAEAITAATGVPHVVDHQIPLHGKLVSGLHVHANLQILTDTENSCKW